MCMEQAKAPKEIQHNLAVLEVFYLLVRLNALLEIPKTVKV